MRRLSTLVLSLLFGLFLGANLRAQVVSPPRGGVTTQMQGGGGGGYTGPWTEWSAPYPSTYDQYPLLRFYWCDNSSLAPETRWIKVNGVDQTSSFDYTTEDPSGSCVARASSQSTTVALNLGDNLIEMYICDEDDLGPYCWYGMQYVTRLIAPPQAAPIVSLRNFNGDDQDRSLCLTVGAGQAAGLACGDLFVVHGMPAYRTMGRDRSLTLFYSSHQAAPRPTVAVWVSQPSGQQTPNSVYVELKVGGATRASATYAPWSSASGPRQLVLAYDASGDTSRLVPFTLEVRNQYPDSAFSTTIYDTLIVVNRVGSEFGAGWWLAGVEQLVPNQPGNKILWVGGDGAAAEYRQVVAGSRWARAAGPYRDTLVLAGGVYTRTLRHGIQVKFDAAGRHTHTVNNRTGQTTTFTWTVSSAVRLTSIRVPPGASGPTYTLAYDGSNKLDYISDPAGRVLNATVSGGNLTQLADPDTHSVSFGYDGSRRMTSRTGRRNIATSYAYANALRVTAVRVPLIATDTSVTALEWWDEKGLAIGTPSGTFYSADTLNAFSRVYGPRVGVDDNATFWVDRWGAPVRVIGAETDTTIATRSSQSGLVSRARSPVGQVLLASWDARGNLLTLSDSTHEGSGTVVTATTSYTYGDTRYPDSPTEVHAPTGETTVFHYHESLGLPDTITAPGGARTAFAYVESGGRRGLMQSVTVLGVRVVDTLSWTFAAPASLVTSVAYDALGNDTSASRPSGSRPRTIRDQYGRVYRADDPAGHRTDYAYDLMNRLRISQVFDTSASFSTVYSYDTSGALWRIQDPRGVSREWSYDWADRDTLMTGEAGYTERRTFDRAGLLVSLRTRTGWTVTHEYDRAGRRTRTVTPRQIEHRDPSLPNPGYVEIPADTFVYQYDPAGRLTSARRRGSEITTTYNREGTLQTERQVTRNPMGQVVSDFTTRTWYDGADRRVTFFNGTDTLRYSYGPDGLLSTLAVRWVPTALAPDTFLFAWDALGRRDSVVYRAPGVRLRYGYDADGRLRLVCSRHPANTQYSDALEQILQFSSMTRDGLPLTVQASRGGEANGCLHAIEPLSTEVYDYDSRHQVTRDPQWRYAYDSSGNQRQRFFVSGSLQRTLAYLSVDGRKTNSLLYELRPSGEVERIFRYDSAGSLIQDMRPSAFWNIRWYFYNSLGEMAGYKEQVSENIFVGDGYMCRYDALGRRVLACSAGGGWSGFDGDNVIRQGGSWVGWRFVHGPGIDDPLVGMWQIQPGQTQRFYYLTAGQGRLLAFTDSVGTDRSSEPVFTSNGGNQAGAIAKSRSFDNERAVSSSAPGLSFYRGRYYDQRTGRWTQEDPIGPAGGINLYAYVGNNPATYTDPFGLCPDYLRGNATACANWNTERVAQAQELYNGERGRGNRGARIALESVQGGVRLEGVNGDEIQARCGKSASGRVTSTGCLIGGTNLILLNADRRVPAIAATLSHEMVHAGGWGPEGLPQLANFLFVKDLGPTLAEQARRGGAGSAPTYPILPGILFW